MTDMLQLAHEAVENRNFDLATEIFDRLLKDSEPTTDVLVSKGECLAKAGRLSEAFDAYALACRLGEVQPEKLTCLVDSLVGKLCNKEGLSVQECINKPLDMFSCLLCHNILFEPTTLCCGHTFCKSCFIKHKARTCKMCNEFSDSESGFPVNVDVLLSGQLEKYFSSAYKAAKLKNEANVKFNEGDFDGAMKLYSDAAALAPVDHLIASNKSYVLSEQKRFSEAIKEADRACKLQPLWPKGYFRKGRALMMAGKYEEALMSLLQGLSLDPNVTSAKTTLAQVLQKILTPLPTSENLKCPEIQHHGILGRCVRGMSTPFSVFSSGFDDLASAILVGFNQSVNGGSTSINQSGDRGSEGNNQSVDRGILSSNQSMQGESARSDTSSQSSSTEVYSKTSKSVASKSGSNSDDTKSKDEVKTKDASDIGAVCAQKKRKHSDLNTGTELKACEPRLIAPHLLNRSDYECSLCFRLLHKPVTTPCGHTFCTGCLNRCLDHNARCPLCKHSLTEYLASKKFSVNVLIQKIMKQYFEKEFHEREEIHAEEMEELRGASKGHGESVIPLFICTIAFPTIPCPLHIFEPRYRLMIRQCIESGSRQFGMCVPSEQNEFSDYGCMLKIQEVQTLPDGRSIIRTVGGKRFKVLSRGMREGYNTANVKFIEDETVQEDDFNQLNALHQSVYSEASSWFNALRSVIRSRISKHYGAMPALPENPLESSDGPGWTWWLLAVLPVEPRAQLECMSMTNLRERLLFLRRCLRAMSET